MKHKRQPRDEVPRVLETQHKEPETKAKYMSYHTTRRPHSRLCPIPSTVAGPVRKWSASA